MMKERTLIGNVCIDNETIFEVGRFAILWNIFENKKCDYACSNEKIMQINESIEQSRKEPFQNLAKELSNRANKFAFSVDTYVTNNVYPRNGARITQADKDTHMPIVMEFIKSNGEKEMLGALLSIFRIRNNMFHGLKESVK